MKRKIALTLLVILSISCVLTACLPKKIGKRYSDYPNVWATKDSCVMLDPTGEAAMQLDDIDPAWEIEALSDSGQGYLYFCYKDPNAIDDSNCIWEASAKIHYNKLYLTIEKDYYTNHEGETLILEQTDIPSLRPVG